MRTIWLVAALSLFVACGESANAPNGAALEERGCKVGGGNAHIDYVDFVMLESITYVSHYTEMQVLTEDDLGEPYGQVLCRLSDNVTDPGYRSQNGDAGFLEPGTVVYEVTGYDPEFRVAARGLEEGGYTLYEADTVPNARVGADLLDIDGKVRLITINSRRDGSTEIARIGERSEIRRMVHMVLSAPVDQDRDIPGGNGEVVIEFHLVDGTSVLRNFYPSEPELLRGIQVPEAFAKAVEDALDR